MLLWNHLSHDWNSLVDWTIEQIDLLHLHQHFKCLVQSFSGAWSHNFYEKSHPVWCFPIINESYHQLCRFKAKLIDDILSNFQRPCQSFQSSVSTTFSLQQDSFSSLLLLSMHLWRHHRDFSSQILHDA